MREVSEREIWHWSSQSEDNAKLYTEYARIKREADAAYAARDGAAYTGLAITRTKLRIEIERRMT